jgi:rubrerythrin
MKKEQLHELLCQAIEHEKGGVQVYTAAIELAQNEDLRKEWEKYLEETRRHVELATEACSKLGFDPDAETPGREVVRHHGQALLEGMKIAAEGGDPKAAQIVAAESVVLAETKDHLNWELIGQAVTKLSGSAAQALGEAHEEVEDQEDEHLYHSTGWARELWLESLDLPAVLPPPEEKKHVKTAIGAARAKQARTDML